MLTLRQLARNSKLNSVTRMDHRVHQTRQESVQHLRVLSSFSTVLQCSTKVEVIREDKAFEGLGMRVCGKVLGEVRHIGCVVPVEYAV